MVRRSAALKLQVRSAPLTAGTAVALCVAQRTAHGVCLLLIPAFGALHDVAGQGCAAALAQLHDGTTTRTVFRLSQILASVCRLLAAGTAPRVRKDLQPLC